MDVQIPGPGANGFASVEPSHDDVLNDIPLSPRLVLLWNQSYAEAGADDGDIPSPTGHRIALYPRSFVERVRGFGSTKSIDFNFRGAVYIDPLTRANRQWVIDFAARHFTDRSFFQVTDSQALRRTLLRRRHRMLGRWDHTFARKGFVPKENHRSRRDYFDEDYFRLMSESQFTLCPAGDAPWSMRFYEAILAGSIPILEKRQHAGRNVLEYDIGYRYYLLDAGSYEFRQDWVDENFQKFLRFQTLMNVAAPAEADASQRPGAGADLLQPRTSTVAP